MVRFMEFRASMRKCLLSTHTVKQTCPNWQGIPAPLQKIPEVRHIHGRRSSDVLLPLDTTQGSRAMS